MLMAGLSLLDPFTPEHPYIIPAANYTRKPDVAIYYFRDTPFLMVIK